MPSKEEWFTYDTTVFLHLNNHIHNQKKRNARKKTRKWWTFTAHNGISSHHLQLLFWFLFPFLMCHTDLSLSSERGHSSSEWKESISKSHYQITLSHSRFHPCSIYSRLYEKYVQKHYFVHPVSNHSSTNTSTIRCSAKWNHIVVKKR